MAADVFLGRQPILDREGKLFAYELLFRSGRANAAHVTDDLVATASVIGNVFAEIGIETVLGAHKGFINCDAGLLCSDMLEALPADKIVLEVLETVEITDAIVARCRDLKARGFTLALDDFVSDADKWAPLLELVDIVKVDILPLSAAQLEAETRSLRRWPLKLLAEKVDSREQAEHCRQLGYILFQGYYFAKPAIIAGRKLDQSELALMQLLGLILEDAETTAVEEVFKREPGLAMNLMRLTNSAAAGLRTRVTSLRHAITVLGRRQLQRWLQLLLYTNPAGGTTSSPLLHMAATRGRLMELLAGARRPGATQFEDLAFMTGIMSLMPALIGMPLPDILKGIEIAREVRAALLDGEGDLAVMLALCEALEAGDGTDAAAMCARLPGLDADVVNRCQTQALAWAASIGHEAE